MSLINICDRTNITSFLCILLDKSDTYRIYLESEGIRNLWYIPGICQVYDHTGHIPGIFVWSYTWHIMTPEEKIKRGNRTERDYAAMMPKKFRTPATKK